MTIPEAIPELSQYTMTDLFEEVARRTMAVILVTAEEAKNKEGKVDCYYWYAGGFHAALGLMENAKAKILHEQTEGTDEP